jgi:hypothetical protein
MNFFNRLLRPASRKRRRSTRFHNNDFVMETLEPRIAFDASGLERPTLEPVADTSLSPEVCMVPSPTGLFWSGRIAPRSQNFTITNIAEGITVEKWNADSNKWEDIATTPSTSNPKDLMRLLELRVFKPDDRYRVTRANENISSDNPFQAVWADGSEARGLIRKWMPGPACGPIPRPLPIRSPSGEWKIFSIRQIAEMIPPNTQPFLFKKDIDVSKHNITFTDLIDENLTPADRAFIDLSLTNPVDTVPADEEEVTPYLVTPALDTATLTISDMAYSGPDLISHINTDLTDLDLNDSKETKKSIFATILPTPFDSASSVIQAINQ